MIKKKATMAAAAAAVLVLAGCWGGTPTSDQNGQAPSPSSSTSPSCILSCQDAPQAANTGPASLAAEPSSEKAAVDAAAKVMTAYADVSKPKDAWFQALAPLITTAWAQDAQYIQPSRLPVRKLTTGPSMVTATVPDGHQVRVKFGTDAGDWVVIMTRASEGAPWLASDVQPAKDAQ